MTIDRPVEYIVSLVRESCSLTGETEWVEFKVNDHEPHEIGEYISALANSAALVGKGFAYMVRGGLTVTMRSAAPASIRAPRGSETKCLRTGFFGCSSRESTSASSKCVLMTVQ